MSNPGRNGTVPRAEFARMYRKYGPKLTADALGITEVAVKARAARLELVEYNGIPGRSVVDVENGIVLVGSDGQYWPSEVAPTGHRALVKFAADLQPVGIVYNGDALDAPTISRHSRIGWEEHPTLIQEIDEVTKRMQEIEDAAPNAWKVWPLGNHDARFETFLAAHVPQYEGVKGIHLQDHFPQWWPTWSLFINDRPDGVVVKHRWKGGTHAAFNNARESGRSMVTGHLHSLKVTPYTDYNGTRYGVDSGTLQDPFGPMFTYSEDRARDWRSGFVVLTFKNGRLLWPEVVHVAEPGVVEFRGELYDV